MPIESEKNYKKEQKEREAKRTELQTTHVKELARRKAEVFEVGHPGYDGDSIASKTDKGLMTTSRHPKTGEIHHVWHDEPKIVTEKSGTGHKSNGQMRDNGGDIDHKTENGESISKQLKPSKNRKLSA
jgi:hypothetical protein